MRIFGWQGACFPYLNNFFQRRTRGLKTLVQQRDGRHRPTPASRTIAIGRSACVVCGSGRFGAYLEAKRVAEDRESEELDQPPCRFEITRRISDYPSTPS